MLIGKTSTPPSLPTTPSTLLSPPPVVCFIISMISNNNHILKLIKLRIRRRRKQGRWLTTLVVLHKNPTRVEVTEKFFYLSLRRSLGFCEILWDIVSFVLFLPLLLFPTPGRDSRPIPPGGLVHRAIFIQNFMRNDFKLFRLNAKGRPKWTWCRIFMDDVLFIVTDVLTDTGTLPKSVSVLIFKRFQYDEKKWRKK